MPDLCPEPTSEGDLYVRRDYPAQGHDTVLVAEECVGVGGPWLVVGPGRQRFSFSAYRDVLQLLARREDVGAVVLAAMRWAEAHAAWTAALHAEGGPAPSLPLVACTEADEALLAAVRAARESAHG